ncbi:MAG: bifunctional DNA-binding transcriptional regulator/O6-methylguanine-DNA methyltransferase Ada [Gemmatimonadaceae bacterium]
MSVAMLRESAATTTPERAVVEPDEAWRAVLARDARLDGQFVYAVATTGVYCRPTCPSRRPKRSNVSFHPSAHAAELAGFRACRRCRPRAASAPGVQAVEEARALIDRSLDEGVTLTALARQVNLSPFHLQRTFKKFTGLSPREYLAARRAERLKGRLRLGESVSRATYEAGYGSSSRVYETANDTLGMTPATYRRGGRGAHIRYTVVKSSLGLLLVGGTERGICAVMLGESEQGLEQSLAAEYPHATRERDGGGMEEWVRAILDHLEGRGAGAAAAVPLDVQGTVFQLRVWKALREIPPGATRSYSEVAASIGAPTAARAVARACAGNRAAVLIPCHRVVREDGALGGYRWGVERKKRLLESEVSDLSDVSNS